MKRHFVTFGLTAALLGCGVAPLQGAPATAATPFERAEFGQIIFDWSGARSLEKLVSRPKLEKNIKKATAKKTLIYRAGAPGIYRVSVSSDGHWRSGEVRVSVTIVGQNRFKAVRARGENRQLWSDSPPLPFNPLEVPRDREDIRVYPYPLPGKSGARRGNGCAPNPTPDKTKPEETDTPPAHNAPDPNPAPRPPTHNAPDPLPGPDAGRGRGNPNRPLPSSRPAWEQAREETERNLSQFKRGETDEACRALERAIKKAREAAETDFAAQLRGK